MENYDPQLAARVWQRVRKTDALPAETPCLQEQIAREWVAAQVLWRLSRGYRGAAGNLLRRLARQKQSNCTMLKGIGQLQQSSPFRVARPPLPKGTPRQLLQSCYDSTDQCNRVYEALKNDPRHGSVYARLAERSRDHCLQLLTLLGNP